MCAEDLTENAEKDIFLIVDVEDLLQDLTEKLSEEAKKNPGTLEAVDAFLNHLSDMQNVFDKDHASQEAEVENTQEIGEKLQKALDAVIKELKPEADKDDFVKQFMKKVDEINDRLDSMASPLDNKSLIDSFLKKLKDLDGQIVNNNNTYVDGNKDMVDELKERFEKLANELPKDDPASKELLDAISGKLKELDENVKESPESKSQEQAFKIIANEVNDLFTNPPQNESERKERVEVLEIKLAELMDVIGNEVFSKHTEKNQSLILDLNDLLDNLKEELPNESQNDDNINDSLDAISNQLGDIDCSLTENETNREIKIDEAKEKLGDLEIALNEASKELVLTDSMDDELVKKIDEINKRLDKMMDELPEIIRPPDNKSLIDSLSKRLKDLDGQIVNNYNTHVIHMDEKKNMVNKLKKKFKKLEKELPKDDPASKELVDAISDKLKELDENVMKSSKLKENDDVLSQLTSDLNGLLANPSADDLEIAKLSEVIQNKVKELIDVMDDEKLNQSAEKNKSLVIDANDLFKDLKEKLSEEERNTHSLSTQWKP